MIVLPPGLWVVCPRMPGAALSALGESAGTGSCVFSFPAASPQMGVLPPGLARRKGTAAVKIERQFFPCCRTARLQKREEPGVRFQAKVDALWRRESGRGRESRFPSPPASLQKMGALALRPARRKGAASGRTCEREWMPSGSDRKSTLAVPMPSASQPGLRPPLFCSRIFSANSRRRAGLPGPRKPQVPHPPCAFPVLSPSKKFCSFENSCSPPPRDQSAPTDQEQKPPLREKRKNPLGKAPLPERKLL